ncbi:MAG TPA: hypothetical protein VGO34_09510 [Alphaproteobacteria bacterium]
MRLVSAALLLVSLFVLWLAAPRFAAGVATAPHGDTVANADRPGSGAPGDGALARAIAGHRKALSWRSDPGTTGGLGKLYLIEAQRSFAAGDAETGRGLLRESVLYGRASLAAAPLQPYVWTRLVQAEVGDGAPADEAARHLSMAMETAPWEPALAVAQLGLAFMLWDQFDPATQASFGQHVRYAARFYPGALARQTRQHRAQDQVLRALEDDPDLLRRFSLAYSRL